MGVRRAVLLFALAVLGPGAFFASVAAEPRVPKAHDAGVVEGSITAVDYQRSVITVATSKRGKIDVRVVPGTNIQGRAPGYHGIADLVRGARVEIFASQVGDRYIAQIIRIL
jgi:hypothetical protein